jgi:hypothetical protein
MIIDFFLNSYDNNSFNENDLLEKNYFKKDNYRKIRKKLIFDIANACKALSGIDIPGLN